MDVSHFILSQHMNWIIFSFIPGEGGARVMLSGMSGSSLPQRHYCLGERTSVAFQKSCMSEKWMRVRNWKMPIIWVFDSILVLLKSVLIFHHWGFYGTDSIHEKSDGHDLIFQVQNVRNVQREGQVLVRGGDNTIDWSVSAIFNRTDWKKDEGQDTEEFSSVWSCVLGAQDCMFVIHSYVWTLMTRFRSWTLEGGVMSGCDWPSVLARRRVSRTKYFWMVSFFSDTAAVKSGDAKSIQKKHCHKI